jgi:hypothetical protein
MDKKTVHFSSSVPVNAVSDSLDKNAAAIFSSSCLKPKNFLYRFGKEDICELPEGSRRWIKEVLEAVLDEQVDQWANGETNPERMASVYRKYSKSSQAKAIACGLKTHDEAALART